MIFLTEHVSGVAVRAYFPISGVAGELASKKHPAHVGHIGYIPLADVAIE